jgi:hypothetical protein
LECRLRLKIPSRSIYMYFGQRLSSRISPRKLTFDDRNEDR